MKEDLFDTSLVIILWILAIALFGEDLLISIHMLLSFWGEIFGL